MKEKKEQKPKQILEFIRYIKRHKNFCTKLVAAELGITVRSVQRLKKYLEELYGFKFTSTSRGCYTIPQKIDLDEFDAKEFENFEKFIDIAYLTQGSFLRYFGFDTKQIIQKNGAIFLLKSSPFEELIKCDLLSHLKKTIYHKKYIDITYHAEREYFFPDSRPLKILYAENNWYLAALTKDEINGGFKFLRINFIKDIKEQSRTFKTPAEAKYFFDRFQTLFSSYVDPYYEVKVQVDAQVARHFKVKKFLTSQRILQELPNGDLILSYTINNENEILLLAKRWLPHMRILEPASLQRELRKIVKKFLDDTE